MIIDMNFEIPNGAKMLHLKASVKNLQYYQNVYLGKLQIFTADNMTEPVYTRDFTKENTKTADLYINEISMMKTIKDNLFIAKFYISGKLDANTPCGMDTDPSQSAAFDICPLMNSIVNYARELDSECEIPKKFIDILLRYQAYRYAVMTGNIDRAISMYEKFFSKGVGKNIVKGCGCGCH